ncbi:M17 family peptidase N-terminal domain-containing protein [Chondromyces crocatus]|uniref:Leucyl aminopeptidase n=1 Tax=Chondromyces crocatus TaxID=52 RepID=A0A0K1E6N4_CHOCO|nr:M17 family peptidase N-terminal domain-containing protein [Chondromyces crocatus]AKT36514.1 leucyl aminopeptidase [Chondromyces crocatus]
MELRFVSPDLASLDMLDAEVLACPVWADIRPAHGVAGLCDWRLGGRISELQRRGLVTGELGEVVMLPGKPRMSLDKLILFGAGTRAAFDESVFVAIVNRMLSTLRCLGARVAVVELPGRQDRLIRAEAATDALLDCAEREREGEDLWMLVEGAEGKQQIAQHMIEQRRRLRRAL